MAIRSKDDDMAVMGFGDHLEELRKRILRALIVAGIGVLVALFFQHHLLRFLTVPHRKVMLPITARREAGALAKKLEKAHASLADLDPQEVAAAVERLDKIGALREDLQSNRGNMGAEERGLYDGFLDVLADHQDRYDLVDRLRSLTKEIQARFEEEGASRAPARAQEHLDRVRETAEAIVEIVMRWETAEARGGGTFDWRPIEDAVAVLVGGEETVRKVIHLDFEQKTLKALGYPDAFFANLKVCFLAGLILALPWLTFEIWGFIAKGLYAHERRSVYPFLPASMFCLILGALFAYYVMIPVGLGYLGGFGADDVVEAAFTLKNYLSLVFTLILGLSLVFQLPLIMIFLAQAEIVDVAAFRKNRRISIVACLALSAFLTPPDVITQLLMAGPLIFLYESGIWISALLIRRKKKRTRAEGGWTG